jgi:predicted DNA-binding protein YlxM (UPF0122 family)
MNIKTLVFGITILCSLSALGQDQKLVVVNGFLTNKDSAYVVNYFQDDILSMEILPPDSAKLLIGEYGNYGIIVIRTLGLNVHRPNIFFKEEHRLFSDKPKIILDDEYREDLDINMIIDPGKFDTSSIDKIKVISPFNAVAKYGFEMKGGVWEVYTKEN